MGGLVKTVLEAADEEMLDLILWERALSKARWDAHRRRDWAAENFFSMWFWEIESRVEALR